MTLASLVSTEGACAGLLLRSAGERVCDAGSDIGLFSLLDKKDLARTGCSGTVLFALPPNDIFDLGE